MTERGTKHNNNNPGANRVSRGQNSRPVTKKSSAPNNKSNMKISAPKRGAKASDSKTTALAAIGENIKPILSVKQDNVKTVKKKSRKSFPVGAVVIVTICTLLLMFTVVSYVQINEYTIEVASLRGELSDLVEKSNDLEVSLEEKNDMLEIERIATEEYGMVKSDQLTKKHISLEQEDKIEVVETEPSEDMTVVSSVMSAIASNFQGLWEYME